MSDAYYQPTRARMYPGPMPVPMAGAMGATRITLDQPQCYHLANWDKMPHTERMKFLRKSAEQRAMDPRLRDLAARILLSVEQRQYERQAAAILQWVQQHIRYLNEPNEILQDPLVTLQKGYGDCDDMALLLACLYEAVRLPWRFVLSGRLKGASTRWVEGTPFPSGMVPGHIYVVVGWPPFRPTTWRFAEPTVKGRPLGWDATNMRQGAMPLLPELGAMPNVAAGAGAAVATSTAEGRFFGLDAATVGRAVVLGTLTSVLGALAGEWARRAFFKR